MNESRRAVDFRSGYSSLRIACSKSEDMITRAGLSGKIKPRTNCNLRPVVFSLILFTATLLLQGCTVGDAVEQIKPTDFITSPQLLHKPDRTPFDLAWSAPDINTHQYDTVVINPVRTDKINSDQWIFSASTFIASREAYLDRVSKLAKYIQSNLTERFTNYSRGDLKVSAEAAPPLDLVAEEPNGELPVKPEPEPLPLEELFPGGRIVVIDVSIAEADFGDPLIYGGLLAVPFPGLANLSTAVKAPSLTLEARLTDPTNGEVLTELVDRRFPQIKIIDINRLTISSALHEIVDSFSDDLVASFYREHGERVGKRLPFSLLPW